jgi:hypothetical protein
MDIEKDTQIFQEALLAVQRLAQDYPHQFIKTTWYVERKG